jgi:peptidase E
MTLSQVMANSKGTIVLMGSGELTATMVEVHKDLLARFMPSPQAVFLDTPAGFQLNVDQISQKAVEYFRSRVGHPLSVASFKCLAETSDFQRKQAFHTLREADFILIGPGSPTYALRQWQATPVPEIFRQRIQGGGCLVAASAAALTVGCYTLPVYEIYKVGEEPHWLAGMNLLGHFGFDLVVVPHWNNAEGGTHDTRFCFMGQHRFESLESLLPKEVAVFGLDEHTACILHLDSEQAEIRGIGRVILRRGGSETIFEKGDRFPLDVLRGRQPAAKWQSTVPGPRQSESESEPADADFWNRLHALETECRSALENDDARKAANALLELDRSIWQAQHDLENEESIIQAREVLRDLIVLIGMQLTAGPKDAAACLAPLLDELLRLRDQFRQDKLWRQADAVRESLQRVGIVVEDTAEGSRWRLQPA